MPNDAEFLQQIRGVFSRCERPEHFTDFTHCSECAEHDALLRSRDNTTLQVEDVGNPGWDPLCYVDSAGLGYFFPALSRLALAEPHPASGWYAPQLLFHLTTELPPLPSSDEPTWNKLMAEAAELVHQARSRKGMVVVFVMTLVGGAGLLTIAVWPGLLEELVFGIPYFLLSLPLLGFWFLLLVGISLWDWAGKPEAWAKRRRWGLWSATVMVATIGLLWFHLPQRIAFAYCNADLRRLVDDAPAAFTVVSLASVTASLSTAPRRDDDPVKQELKKLEGIWVIVAYEIGGERLPAE